MDTAPSFVAGPAEPARVWLGKEERQRDGERDGEAIQSVHRPHLVSFCLRGPVVLRAPNAAKGRLGCNNWHWHWTQQLECMSATKLRWVPWHMKLLKGPNSQQITPLSLNRKPFSSTAMRLVAQVA